MNAPAFLSGLFASQLLETTIQRTNPRRHWHLIFLLLGLCLGWIARGSFN